MGKLWKSNWLWENQTLGLRETCKMYKKYESLIVVLCLCIPLFSSTSYASWSEKQEVISGTWGEGEGQFYFNAGDSFDSFPQKIGIDVNGMILLPDKGNKRIYIYNSDGSISKILTKPPTLPVEDSLYGWPNGLVLFEGGDSFVIWCEYEKISGGVRPLKKCFMNYNSDVIAKIDRAKLFSSNLGYISKKSNIYTLYSPTGVLLQTYAERPLELGRKRSKRSGSVYKTTISYPDTTYTILANEPIGKYYRDESRYLYHIESFVNSNDARIKQVYKYDRCGKQVGMLELPLSSYEPEPEWAKDAPTSISIPIAEYGDPIVSSTGDVYTWVRSKTDYKIVKWVWVDEATDPKGGPDMPEAIQALPSTSGVYLTWNPAPQDPGCVTGYDIERASSAGGTYSSVATVPLNLDQSYNYNDVTAGEGQTWYYRISAKSDIGNSDPVEVNATRP